MDVQALLEGSVVFSDEDGPVKRHKTHGIKGSVDANKLPHIQVCALLINSELHPSHITAVVTTDCNHSHQYRIYRRHNQKDVNLSRREVSYIIKLKTLL